MILQKHPDLKKHEQRAIGYWHSVDQPNLPKPQDFIDATWNKNEKEFIAGYLDNGVEMAAYKGWSNCRICNKVNGSTCLGDDDYIWPEGFSHYVREHNVKPPKEFIDYVREQIL